MSCCKPKPAPGERKFTADYCSKPLTYKFWSKYDSFSKPIDYSKVTYYEEQIEKRKKYDARCHSKIPQYTNQTYGWLPGYKINFLQKCDFHLSQLSKSKSG